MKKLIMCAILFAPILSFANSNADSIIKELRLDLKIKLLEIEKIPQHSDKWWYYIGEMKGIFTAITLIEKEFYDKEIPRVPTIKWE